MTRSPASVAASTNRGELYKTYEALAAGAVDVLEKPAGDDTDDRWARSLVSAVKMVSRKIGEAIPAGYFVTDLEPAPSYAGAVVWAGGAQRIVMQSAQRP